ncbi:MAG: PAS domain S-box protein [Pedosphaera sp.]|nr:PAS domain S-box protein [Pedosphaera sp.]
MKIPTLKFEEPYFALALVVVVVIGSILAYRVWPHRSLPGGRAFLGMVIGGIIWALADGMKLFLDAEQWVVLAYVGIGMLPVAWLAFCLEFIGRSHWLTPGRLTALSLVSVVTVFVVATNDLHHGMWTVVLKEGVTTVHYGKWLLFSEIFSYVQFFIGYGLLVLSWTEASRMHQRQISALLVAGTVPWVANFLQSINVYPRSAPNPTPLAFIVSSIVYFWALFRLQLLEIMPVAQRMVLNQLKDGRVVLGAQDRIIQVNPAAKAMLGIQKADVSGRLLDEVIAGWPALSKDVISSDSVDLEIPREANGETRYFDVKGSVITAVKGQRLGRFFLVRDITSKYVEAVERDRLVRKLQATIDRLRSEMRERRKVEGELHQSENSWRAFCENSVMGIYRITSDGRLSMANPAVIRMLGFDSFDELTRSGSYKTDGEPGLDLKQLLEALGREELDLDRESAWHRRDGTLIWVHQRVRAIRDERGVVVYYDGTIEDITERRQAETNKVRLEEQMRAVQKLESLGVLAGGIAHEFNNLLAAILGNADLARLQLPPESPSLHSLEAIKDASLRAADLCRQMLAYSGWGRFLVESIDLGILIEKIRDLMKTSISKMAVLSIEVEADLPLVEGDATEIRQMVLNLVTNASEAVGDKAGKITVSVGSLHCTREYLQEGYLHDNMEAGHYVWLEVADSGCGMDADRLKRIFEPFYTTKFAGRGLGLSAVLGIVRGHKGALRVQSRPESGSVFRVLPVASRVKEPGVIASHTDKHWTKGGFILVVDDEEIIRDIGKQFLERLDFQVLTASDGRSAVDTYRKQAQSIRLVILDLLMPELSGEDTFRELLRINSKAQVIVASACTQAEMEARFGDQRPGGFIRKPYLLEDLVTCLRQVLG